jgi:hypothetical protein
MKKILIAVVFIIFTLTIICNFCWAAEELVNLSIVNEIYSGTTVGMIKLCLKDNYLLLANWGTPIILDVTCSTNPVVLDNQNWNMIQDSGDICVSDTHAYITDGGDIKVLDITDILNPVEVGQFDKSYYDIVEQRIIDYYIFNLYIHGDYLYASYTYLTQGRGLGIIDISNPAEPFEVGYYISEGIYISKYLLDNYLYIGDFDGLTILDVSNPATPIKISYLDIGNMVDGIHVSGNYACITGYDVGIKILDISNPYEPIEVSNRLVYDIQGFGIYDKYILTRHRAYQIGRHPILNVYERINNSIRKKAYYYSSSATDSNISDAMLIGDYIYTANFYSGYITIFKLGDSGFYNINGYVRTINGTPMGNVKVQLSDGSSILTEDDGSYQFLELFGNNSYTVEPSKIGFGFNPPSIIYSILTEDLDNQNFIGCNSKMSRIKVIIQEESGIKGTINPDKQGKARIYFTSYLSGDFTLRIFNLVGELVYKKTKTSVIGDGWFEWIPEDIASGVYIAHIKGPGIDTYKKIPILR